MSYSEDCKRYHERRLEIAHGIWHKFLSDCPCNRGRAVKSFTQLTDEEIEMTASALQKYIQETS